MSIYRINPFCTECGEEHAYFDIKLTEEEQEKYDEFYRVNANKSFKELLFMEPPLIVKRKLRCPACGKVFEGKAAVDKYSCLDTPIDNSRVPVGRYEV